MKIEEHDECVADFADSTYVPAPGTTHSGRSLVDAVLGDLDDARHTVYGERHFTVYRFHDDGPHLFFGLHVGSNAEFFLEIHNRYDSTPEIHQSEHVFMGMRNVDQRVQSDDFVNL